MKQYKLLPAKGHGRCLAAKVTVDLAESDGSLLPVLWLSHLQLQIQRSLTELGLLYFTTLV